MTNKHGREQAARTSVKRIQTELNLLDALNEATFNVLFHHQETDAEPISVAVDRTSAKRDRCKASKLSRQSLQGDFCLVRRFGDALFIVVGDAYGHFSYALGLKIVIALCLDRIYSISGTRAPVTPGEIVQELIAFFHQLDAANTTKIGLLGGADIIVMRFDSTKRTISYASAGLPFYLLRVGNIARHGVDSPEKTVGFPSSYDEGPTMPMVDEIDVSNLTEPAFVAVVTDGFEDLRRQRSDVVPEETQDVEQFSRLAVEQALLSGVAKACVAQSAKRRPAEKIARTLVKAARQFRRGHSIPEQYEDDRQIVVVDLEKLWTSILDG